LQYEVLTLGRTPVVSLTAANLTPAGIAALTRDWVLMHSYGRFSVLAPGWAPIPVASDRAPQVGLAVDGNGLIYSATTNQVLRFIPANTVLLSLRVPEPGAAAVLTVVSPPGWQVRLEQSRDFQDWEPWQTLTSTGLDSLALKPESDRLFLRAVLSP
jgi:hypothetical protein